MRRECDFLGRFDNIFLFWVFILLANLGPMLVKKTVELVAHAYFVGHCFWVHYDFVKFISFATRFTDNFGYNLYVIFISLLYFWNIFS